MSRHDGTTDRTNLVVVHPAITRAYWSKRRAWHGEKLTLFVETKHIPDGTTVKLEVWEDDSAEKNPDDWVAEIPGSHSIKEGRLAVDYELKWDQATLGEPLAVVARSAGRSGYLYPDEQTAAANLLDARRLELAQAREQELALPLRPLDGLWIRGGIKVSNAHPVRTGLATTASDHLPIMADLEILPLHESTRPPAASHAAGH